MKNKQTTGGKSNNGSLARPTQRSSAEEARRRIQPIIEAAEQAAERVVDEAEAEAERYLEESRLHADRIAAQRAAEMEALAAALLEHAELVKSQADDLLQAMSDARRRMDEAQQEARLFARQPLRTP
jgi:ATP-dependent Zn protease